MRTKEKKAEARLRRSDRWEYVHARGCVVVGCAVRDVARPQLREALSAADGGEAVVE